MKCIKIIQVNGISFHVEEEACDSLSAYMEALKEYFNNEPGAGEIIADIEARIEELFAERPGGVDAVVTAGEVARVIETLGTVEDIAGSAPGAGSGVASPPPERPFKRIYRDMDRRYIGGVCAGIAHWTGIPAGIIRLLFIVITPLWGFSLVVYLLLYVIIPPARGAAQKLEMTGQPVNIDTIARSVNESFSLSSFRRSLNRFAGGAWAVARGIFRCLLNVTRVVLGIILYGSGLFLLVAPGSALLLEEAIFSRGVQWELLRLEEILPRVVTPLSWWLFLAGGIALILLLAFMCFFWGTWLMFRFKIRRAPVHLAILFAWVGMFILVTCVVVAEIRRHAWENEIMETRVLPAVKTLHLGMTPSGLQLANFPSLEVYYDRKGDRFHGQPGVRVLRGDNASITLDVCRYATGKNKGEAYRRAGETTYRVEARDSLLLFPEFFEVSPGDRWDFQQVRVAVHVPVGTVIVIDKPVAGLLLHRWSWRRGTFDGTSRWVMMEDGDLIPLVK
ncbi:MAG: PspC domain-containing protein [Odoribacteraceae bacterium]|jgi:phage shock protein PspC (stress-responsive transcriptional regulator)|nr:PspC domain-containing protein [Odoribacteraceae bacterium]